MGVTSIEWCDRSINPIRARNKRTGAVGHYCEKISHGCTHCYASTLQKRFNMPGFPAHGASARQALPLFKSDGIPNVGDIKVFLDESKLQDVLRRKKPTKYFWCDMTDLFGSWVPDEWIDKCFATMENSPQHIHQILTKRPERMREYLTWRWGKREDGPGSRIPAKNIWLGVSVENQQTADERIPLLLRTPAAVRFLSVEPLLGPVKIKDCFFKCTCASDPCECKGKALHWVIIGGESGHGARPCDVAGIRSIRDQCKAAGVACFIKQLGAYWSQHTIDLTVGGKHYMSDRKGGDMAEWPADLRVREFPEVPMDELFDWAGAPDARGLCR